MALINSGNMSEKHGLLKAETWKMDPKAEITQLTRQPISCTSAFFFPLTVGRCSLSAYHVLWSVDARSCSWQ